MIHAAAGIVAAPVAPAAKKRALAEFEEQWENIMEQEDKDEVQALPAPKFQHGR